MLRFRGWKKLLRTAAGNTLYFNVESCAGSAPDLHCAAYIPGPSLIWRFPKILLSQHAATIHFLREVLCAPCRFSPCPHKGHCKITSYPFRTLLVWIDPFVPWGWQFFGEALETPPAFLATAILRKYNLLKHPRHVLALNPARYTVHQERSPCLTAVSVPGPGLSRALGFARLWSCEQGSAGPTGGIWLH